MNWLGEIVQANVTIYDTVLDLGCGIMQATDPIRCKEILGCDLFERYLNHIKNDYNTVKLSMDETDRFMDDSYDIVLCLDVVEHLDKKLALHVLDECKRICRKKVIIYTPTEFNDNHQKEEGAWGLGENPLQTHRCVITSKELTEKRYSVTNPMGDGWLGVYTK